MIHTIIETADGKRVDNCKKKKPYRYCRHDPNWKLEK